ncbi:MAG: hypothetical protein ABJL43_10210 [Maribacter dokdonensis]|uniref:AbiTii domain-containing protein n=1 Tax=Maribacter dokdonensis TaxID=320912 RepID=UPI003299719F
MNNISEWIDKIIEDLVNPNIKLSDTLLKVQVLAFKIENTVLKEWTEREINGYVGKDKPDYRRIPSATKGNLIQDAGFRGVWTKNNTLLPVEYLNPKIRDSLMSIKMDSSVAELERMIESKGSYQVNLPYVVCQEFSKIMEPWNVDSAWQKISLNSIEGIISTIKSTLLNFLLELNKEFGDNDNLSVMKKKKEINEIFDKTIGNISGEHINISFGNKTAQTTNTGDNSTTNIAAGEKIHQQIEIKSEVEDFLKILKEHLDNLDLSTEDKEDVSNEITRVESQLKRDNPKLNIVGAALNTINGILTGITANAFTPIVLEKLSQVVGMF